MKWAERRFGWKMLVAAALAGAAPSAWFGWQARAARNQRVVVQNNLQRAMEQMLTRPRYEQFYVEQVNEMLKRGELSGLPGPQPEPPSVEACFSTETDLAQTIAEQIGQATRSVQIQVESIAGGTVVDALLEAARRGVQVELIVGEGTEAPEACKLLAAAGVRMLADGYDLSAETSVFLIDASHVLTRSVAAPGVEPETLLVIRNAPDLAKKYEENFARHCAHSGPYTARAGD